MTSPSQTIESKTLTMFAHEQEAMRKGYSIVAGIDEAGRGPLAGPVVAACVILPEDISPFVDVKDSKKCTPKKRRELFIAIHNHAKEIGVGIVDAHTIDKVNILQATFIAMEKAVNSLKKKPDFLLIDGNRKPGWAADVKTIVSGEAHSLSIAAASIVAKEMRDRIMHDYDQVYPQWGFAKHKGYGTSEHLAAIREHGICDIHRRTFAPIPQLNLNFSKT